MKFIYLSVIDSFIKKQNSIKESDLSIVLKDLQYDLKSFKEDFIEKNYVLKHNNTYHLNFQDIFLMSLKKSHDILCFESLENNLRTEIKLVIEDMLNQHETNIKSIFLIGSAARNKIREYSDIDLLVICNDKFDYSIKNTYKKFQLIIYSIDEFKTKYEQNSELLIWSFQAGLLLYDVNFINKYYKHEKIQISNNTILDKRKMIKKIMDRFSSSKMYFDNLDITILRQLIYHMARYILMLNHVLPLSKAEILDQFKEIDSEGARLFSKIIHDTDHNKIDLDTYVNYYYQLTNYFKKYLNDY